MTEEADVRETPPDLYQRLHAQHHFTLDACASHSNAKVPGRYYTERGLFGRDLEGSPVLLHQGDGLTGSWKGERVWCNPPYSDIPAWLMKAWDSGAERVVMLLPATRTEQAWWQDGVEPLRDGKASLEDLAGLGWRSFSVDFLPGRVHFLEDGHPIWRKNKDGSLYLNAKGETVRSSPKFGVCTLTWRS
jgi:DNA N-6-adenine-methyltransferase Dam